MAMASSVSSSQAHHHHAVFYPDSATRIISARRRGKIPSSNDLRSYHSSMKKVSKLSMQEGSTMAFVQEGMHSSLLKKHEEKCQNKKIYLQGYNLSFNNNTRRRKSRGKGRMGSCSFQCRAAMNVTMLDDTMVPSIVNMVLDHTVMPSVNMMMMLDHTMISSVSMMLNYVVMASVDDVMGGHMMESLSTMLDHMMMNSVSSMLDNMVMAVGVGLPCTVMECGDVVYRSTLPRSNALNITPPGVLLTVIVASYLWATPGVAPGFWDMFLLAPLEQLRRTSYKKEDFNLGRKLGEGAFGTVYKASFSSKQNGKGGDLVVKKASEYGAVEIWMNERVRRACPKACADYIYGFLETSSKGKDGEYWLVWRYEGDATLFDLMNNKEFPYNVEEMILGRTVEGPRSLERESRIIQTIMKQILSALQGLHKIGIVHRDVKPQNIIFSQESRTFKIIDLGAAADLRVGINYIPKEFLLDPRYAAPEQYIMSTQTPSAPPAPVAAALSPVLWQMNSPDRFDIYSAGLIFLQMAFPNLRTDSALIQFNRQLKRCEYEMAAWRELTEPRANADIRRGFDILDLDGGVGWELLLAMVRYKGRQRISATNALSHPYFDREGLMGLTFMQKLKLELIRASRQDPSEAIQWVYDLLAKSGTSAGGFTEMQLLDLKDIQPSRKATFQRNVLASALQLRRKVARTVSETIDDISTPKKEVWWSRWIPRDN